MKREYVFPSVKVLAYEAEQDLAILSAKGEWELEDQLPKDEDFEDPI